MNHPQQTALAFDPVDVDDTARIAATRARPAVDHSDTSRRPDHSGRPIEPRRDAPTRGRRTHPSREHTLAAFPHGTAAAVGDEPADPRPAPLLLTIPEAGRLLGLGRSTMYELIGSGEVEVIHIGRAARIPVDSVERLIARLRSASHPRR
ncbi:MAG: helix-turn-helix domain-containing protein [Acidimicrobiia bacterium]|jgi:excisionase family DNA binding protein